MINESQDEFEISKHPQPTVLLVDDDPALRRAYARVLLRDGFDVVEAGDGIEALALVAERTFDVIVSDILMPGMTGTDLLRAVRRRELEVPVILMTGTPGDAIAAESKSLGALHVLGKPVEPDRLLRRVSHAERLGRLARAKRLVMDAMDSPFARAGDLAGLDESLTRALNSVWMAYQPIVRASDGGLFAYEALLRTRDTSLPHVSAVLQAAEQLGRVGDVGRRVRALATVPFAHAHHDGLLFINIHASDLTDDDLLSSSTPLAAMAGRVVLEVTERAGLETVPDARDRLQHLRSLGYRIAVDDLGAGYAGLTSFVTLEPEFVKLDMSLIHGIDASSTKQAVVKSMAGVCRELGIAVVAEGIETRAELDCATALGCDLLQGYLIARPGPAFPPLAPPRHHVQ